MKKKTKIIIPLSIDIKLSNLIDKLISNRSRYIEYLIYEELKRKNVKDIEKIFI